MFVDRCLPPAVAVGLNRFDEIHAVHMADVYDRPQDVPDTQWLADAGKAGWVGVTQNPAIAQVYAERAAIVENSTRVYCLARADYPAVTKGLVLGRNLLRIFRTGDRPPEPGFWRISERPPRRDVP